MSFNVKLPKHFKILIANRSCPRVLMWVCVTFFSRSQTNKSVAFRVSWFYWLVCDINTTWLNNLWGHSLRITSRCILLLNMKEFFLNFLFKLTAKGWPRDYKSFLSDATSHLFPAKFTGVSVVGQCIFANLFLVLISVRISSVNFGKSLFGKQNNNTLLVTYTYLLKYFLQHIVEQHSHKSARHSEGKAKNNK